MSQRRINSSQIKDMLYFIVLDKFPLLCWYCSVGRKDYDDILEHYIQCHPHEEEFKCRSLELSEVSGELIYVTKHFNITISSMRKKIADGFIPVIAHTSLSFKRSRTPCSPAVSPAPKAQKQLFTEGTDKDEWQGDNKHSSSLLHELSALLPDVCKILAEKDPIHGKRLLQMFTLLKDENFPLENICFKFFEDLVQWFLIDSATEMRYGPDVRKFWFIGKRLFHGKFIEYMRGPCFRGESSGERYRISGYFGVGIFWRNHQKVAMLIFGVFIFGEFIILYLM